jgi:hypothetical protein
MKNGHLVNVGKTNPKRTQFQSRYMLPRITINPQREKILTKRAKYSHNKWSKNRAIPEQPKNNQLFIRLLGHPHLVVLSQLSGCLVPFTCAIAQTVLAMTICAELFTLA